ncbi:hypothetical protein [Spirillospora sp. CA-294931]|uniref:hypothetical protein n=1 Tax=Spirillospora sp. CA-294931 TaxID=3240042 RepID=UPI003D90AFD4
MNDSDLAQVLFTTPLQASDHPSDERIESAIHDHLTTYGARACAARVAQEAGDHPEAYAARMRWALATVTRLHPQHTYLAA